MSARTRLFWTSLVSMALAVALNGSGAHAEDVDALAWQVGKSSGDVWVTTSGVQPAALTGKVVLKPGDTIRTGRNGRVLLTRGEETILVTPNSVVALPEKTAEGSTTILQQAGSILLEVEKRHTRSFDVETPYLVAAVKGTQFRVSIGDGNASVAVLRGRVEVADNRSGQYALVLPGQTARVSTHGRGGLSLSGVGALGPIRQGEPRPASVQGIPVPPRGLSAPPARAGRQMQALGTVFAAGDGGGRNHGRAAGALRISVPLGEMKLDVQKVTHGMAHGSTNGVAAGRGANQTVWGSGDLTPGNGIGKAYNLGNNGSGNGLGSGNGSSGGNGDAGGSASAGGNGIGNAYGLNGGNGIGNGYGLNGAAGNGQAGEAGNGNGNGNGHGHH